MTKQKLTNNSIKDQAKYTLMGNWQGKGSSSVQHYEGFRVEIKIVKESLK